MPSVRSALATWDAQTVNNWPAVSSSSPYLVVRKTAAATLLFTGVNRSAADAPSDVFSWGNDLKMAWISTSFIAADVVKNHAFRNLTFYDSPSDSMYEERLGAAVNPYAKLAVSPAKMSLPGPAIAGDIEPFHEVMNLWHHDAKHGVFVASNLEGVK